VFDESITIFYGADLTDIVPLTFIKLAVDGA
jgi:hypothetical protein